MPRGSRRRLVNVASWEVVDGQGQFEITFPIGAGFDDPAMQHLLHFIHCVDGSTIDLVKRASEARIVFRGTSEVAKSLVARLIHLNRLQEDHEARGAPPSADNWADEQLRSHDGTGRPERMLRSIGFLVPRKHREAIVGDILQDIGEQRREGYGERKIQFLVCLQLFFAVRAHLVILFGWVAAMLRKLVTAE